MTSFGVFLCRGGAKTKFLTFQHAIELVMVLPGRLAKETRTGFANIIRRYMAGDASLVGEIQANAQSNAPVAQLARASLEAEDPVSIENKKRELELTDVKIKKMKIENRTHELGNINSFADIMSKINPTWKNDTRLRLKTEDWLKNVAFESSSGGQLAISNGSQLSQKSISFSEVARDMGKGSLSHAQLIMAGGKMAKSYFSTHGCTPPKHSQWVDGCERMVNSYTEEDRDLMVAAIDSV